MSESIDFKSAVSTHPIEKQYQAVIHKKADGVYYQVDGDNHYLIFYPGFPNGGESFADIHAPWGNRFDDIPTDGAVILQAVVPGTPTDTRRHAPTNTPTSAPALLPPVLLLSSLPPKKAIATPWQKL